MELSYRGYLSAAHTDIRLKPGCARAINNSPSHEYKIERIGTGPLSGRERRQTSNCHNQRNSFHSAILHGKERPFRESYAKSDYNADRTDMMPTEPLERCTSSGSKLRGALLLFRQVLAAGTRIASFRVAARQQTSSNRTSEVWEFSHRGVMWWKNMLRNTEWILGSDAPQPSSHRSRLRWQ